MDEKAKNAIMDILKSDEMRAYFEELLREQTTKIISSLNAAEEKRLYDEIQELKNHLSQEKEMHSGSKAKIQELEMSNRHLQTLLNDKSIDCESALHQKKEIENKIAFCKMQNEQLVTSLAEEKRKAEEERHSLEEENKIAFSKLKEYEEKFACINSVYTNYCSLPESVKQRMSNIFVRDNIYSLIVAVSDWNSIEGIWSFTKRRIIEDEIEGLAELVALFMSSFSLFTLIEGSGRYELINPVIGERFDSDRHSIKGIKTDGRIEDVLLCGIYDSVTKKTVFKAVVQIQ